MVIESNKIKKIICSEETEAIEQFIKHFNNEMNTFIEEVTSALNQLLEISPNLNLSDDKRKAYISMYLFNAIKNLICSFQLLFMGYIVASGNIMRQFMESIDMAILLNISEAEYEKFLRKGIDYRVMRASDIISRHLETTQISPAAWTEWIEFEKSYNSTSHPSAFALTECMDFSSGNLIIGSCFDANKIDGYLKEINIRISAIRTLPNILQGIYGEKHKGI